MHAYMFTSQVGPVHSDPYENALPVSSVLSSVNFDHSEHSLDLAFDPFSLCPILKSKPTPESTHTVP